MFRQFIVCVRKNGETVYQNVLSSLKSPKNQLKSWKWEFDGSNATYHGLYPRSWTTYDIPELKLRLICKQISPIIPHEYKVSYASEWRHKDTFNCSPKK